MRILQGYVRNTSVWQTFILRILNLQCSKNLCWPGWTRVECQHFQLSFFLLVNRSSSFFQKDQFQFNKCGRDICVIWTKSGACTMRFFQTERRLFAKVSLQMCMLSHIRNVQRCFFSRGQIPRIFCEVKFVAILLQVHGDKFSLRQCLWMKVLMGKWDQCMEMRKKMHNIQQAYLKDWNYFFRPVKQVEGLFVACCLAID